MPKKIFFRIFFLEIFNHNTLKMNTKEQKLQAFGRLLDIMDDLREKCPWDKKQTLESLRHLTIEEIYELADAILENNLDEIKKELGDVLLHLVFYSKIASETQSFDIADVANTVCDKLIERHPHIYGNVVAENEEEVKQNWEKIKLKTGNKSVLQGVPKSLPALVKAFRIQEKAGAVGFDWKDTQGVLAKIKEEIQELENEIQKGNTLQAEKELGDVFFSLVNYARHLKINPENALERTNKKFINRFQYVEKKVQENGEIFSQTPLNKLDTYWEEAKSLEK